MTDGAARAVPEQSPEQLSKGLPKRLPVAVLGAGLTGLAAGLELQGRGVTHGVFEKLHEVGGHARTLEERGFRFDRTGHLLHLRTEFWRKRINEWLGQDLLQVERRSVVFSNGVYTRYPFQANTRGLPPEVAYECLMGFLEAHFGKREGSASVVRNLEEYCLRHFGSGFSRHFMLPYNTKLWGVAPRELGVGWCERFVPRPKLEDVIGGAVGLADPLLGYNARFHYPKQGIGELPTAMARRSNSLHLGVAPTRLVPEQKELWFDDCCVKYDVLISSAPLPLLLDLIERLPDDVLAARRSLRATSLRYLDLALRSPARKDFHWAYVPEARFPFYRVGYYSAFSPHMTPPGKSSLYVELAGRTARPLDQELEDVLPGLIEMGLLSGPEDLEFARERSLEYAYVLYDHQHSAALNTIFPYLESHQVISTGRYGGWNYSSMEDALEFGVGAAVEAELRLGARSPRS